MKIKLMFPGGTQKALFTAIDQLKLHKEKVEEFVSGGVVRGRSRTICFARSCFKRCKRCKIPGEIFKS
jgi:hypothetical protein